MTMTQLLERAPFRSLEHIVKKVAEDFTPSERLSVTESAMRYTEIGDGGGNSKRWSLRRTPYIAEPQDSLTSLDAAGVIFVGPSRTGKSVMLLNKVGHGVMNDPEDMLIVHNDMKNARKWSKGEFDRFLAASTKVRARQMTARAYDNTFDKTFKSGMRINITYPTGPNLSAITVGFVFFMDYDRIPEGAIEGSSAYDIGAVRVRTKGRFGMVAAESSPNPEKEMEDPKWRPENPHQAPPSAGIFELYNRGDRRLWMWQCPHSDCKQWFEGTFDLLKGWQDFPLDQIGEAKDAVYMECPCCGQRIEPPQKDAMNLKGKWVPEGLQVGEDGNLIPVPGMKRRRTKIRSFWLKGPAAGYFSWADLVGAYMEALKSYEDTGAEDKLRQTVTTDQGMYYISKARMSDRNPEDLKDRAEDWGSTQENPTVPHWVRFLVLNFDTQKGSFVGQVTGFGVNGDATVVDGFKIASSNRVNSDGKNLPVDPAAFAEDWDLLVEEGALRSYELADGSGRRMRIKFTTVDSGGEEGVATQAYRFWLRLKERGDGLHRKFALIKGSTKATDPIAQTRIVEAGANKKNPMVRGAIPIIFFGTTITKDTLAGFMRRRVQAEDDEDGGGKLRFPDWMPEWFYKQLTNEIRKPKGWEKIGSRRNETFDLSAYAIGSVSRPVEYDSPFDNIQMHKINWSKPPGWAEEWDDNDLVFGSAEPEVETEVKKKRPSLADLAKKLA